MALKGIEHYKASHHYHHKGPPFDIKHQLMLSDLFLLSKLARSQQLVFHSFFAIFANLYQKQN